MAEGLPLESVEASVRVLRIFDLLVPFGSRQGKLGAESEQAGLAEVDECGVGLELAENQECIPAMGQEYYPEAG